jgi:hypothetical protein
MQLNKEGKNLSTDDERPRARFENKGLLDYLNCTLRALSFTCSAY